MKKTESRNIITKKGGRKRKTKVFSENAGAKFTDVKIMMKVPSNEVQKNIGTDQPKALMFNNPGPVNISNKNPVIVKNKED